ncbi:NADPH-dependent glutamate synthase [Haloplasma contractile]|uniref:Glutamate synthase homotetrameric protein n=1 Tax=Haloplasma contractile SSD-17B TaxID=1033810 RepID=U2FFC8_9MOLU|nr:NADPH-dependent glutamate synthase [Haloplasma contractile]ERJ11620.1 Glutamate synthase homotetrameric protein [Haloplasma contractile SSD-17B]
MPNISLKKVKMPELVSTTRNTNYEEVSLGYSPEMAMEEALRCLNCKHKPCVSGCPVGVNIPEFIQQVASGDFLDAYDTITGTNALPAVCGRVCPQESQCEEVCVRAIKGESVGIGRLERFVADYKMNTDQDYEIKNKSKNGHKVAIVGSGPSGLSCAGDLARLGYDVTIFEAFHTPGGVLVYGIPEFRLPKQIVADEIERLKELGVEIKTNMVIGRVLSIDELIEMGYESIYVGTGAGLPRFMGIEGEELVGVYSANEYLTRINLMKAYIEYYDTPIRKSKSVAVIGGGNVAMDAARSAKRLGAEHVFIIYRRNREQMPARLEEIHHAEEEGITFKVLNNPVKILGDENGQVRALECIKMELGEVDASGRPRPRAIEESNFEIEVDTVIVSIGSSPNPLIKSTTDGLETNNRGCLIVDEKMATTKEGVYAGGDAVTGAATVINAMGAGKVAAKAIDEYIMSTIVNKKAI